jgi:hypothetical protein
MAIAYVDNDYLYGTGTSVASQAVNLGSDAGRAFVLFVTCPGGQSVNSAQITGGTSLTLIDSNSHGNGGNYENGYIFAGVVTETGSQTITLSCTGSGLKFGWVMTYSGVGSIGAGNVSDNFTSGISTGPSVTATSTSGDTVVLVGHDCERSTTAGSWGSATERFDTSGAWGADVVASGTSTNISATLSTGGAWHAGAVSLVPSGGGGGSSNGAAAYYFSQC